MIFQNIENFCVESKMWPSVNYEFEREDEKYVTNYLRQNFNIDVQRVDDTVQLPPMVPGTKYFVDYEKTTQSNCFGEEEMILENQIFRDTEETIFRNTSTENVGHLLHYADFYDDSQPVAESPTSSVALFGDMVLPVKDSTNNQVILPQTEQLKFDKIVAESISNHKCAVDRKESECEPNADDSFICHWAGCGQQLYSQLALVRHIEKNHVDSRTADDFICLWEPCPRHTKPFNARYKLLIHMRVHSGEKPNKCPFPHCTKAFSRLENLKIHQRSHTGERPYACQFAHCSKAFSNSSDRAKHQRTHFDQKPYACQVSGCTKRYTDPSSLRKHIKNHSSPVKQRGARKQKCGNISSFVKKQMNRSIIEKTKTKKLLDGNFEAITYDPTAETAYGECTSVDSLPTDFDIFFSDEFIPYDTVVYDDEVKYCADSSVDGFIEYLFSESANSHSPPASNEFVNNNFNDAAFSLEKLHNEPIMNLEFLLM